MTDEADSPPPATPDLNQFQKELLTACIDGQDALLAAARKFMSSIGSNIGVYAIVVGLKALTIGISATLRDDELKAIDGIAAHMGAENAVLFLEAVRIQTARMNAARGGDA